MKPQRDVPDNDYKVALDSFCSLFIEPIIRRSDKAEAELLAVGAYKHIFTLFQFLSSWKCQRAVLNSTLMVTTQLVPILKPPYMLIEAKQSQSSSAGVCLQSQHQNHLCFAGKRGTDFRTLGELLVVIQATCEDIILIVYATFFVLD